MSDATVPTVRFDRLSRRGVLLGLSGAQVATLAVALVILVVAEYTAGAPGVFATGPAWTALATLALGTASGRPLVAWLPVVSQWVLRRVMGRTTYLARPMSPHEADTFSLPGIPGRLTLTESAETGAGLVFDPRAGTVTAVLELRGRGFILEEPGTQARRVASWGRVLGSLCQQPEIVRIQVLHRTVPGGTAEVRRWWLDHVLSEASDTARRVAELLVEADRRSDRQECLLAVAVRAPAGRHRGTRKLAAASLAIVERYLVSVAEALVGADLDVGRWAGPGRFTQMVRTSYDGRAPRPDARDADGTAVGVLGPMGVAESWDSVRTDTVHHAVYWIEEWPRSDVHPGFLQPLLLAPGVRRSFTLIAEPIPPARALRDIRRAKVEQAADAAQRIRIGRLEDESTRAEAADLLRREQDLVAGHGDFRFCGLITVTAQTADALDEACVATESAAARALCEVRRLVGQQGQAHAAAAIPLARGLL